VRLVRHVASTVKVRVLMTNLLNVTEFPAAEFGDLYHQRWRKKKHLSGSAPTQSGACLRSVAVGRDA